MRGDQVGKPALHTPRGSSSALFAGLVSLLVALYIVFFSWLSVMRHETFQSNAMDLGYTDQVVWNTVHGRFMQFSTLENAPIDLPLDLFRRTDILLAYHVELLLAPISLFYLIYDSPVTLLLLQTVVIGLGALPAFWLARDHLESGPAGLVFAAAYLLAPALEGANLSDFHAVSLTSSLLLFGFWALHRRRYGLFLGLVAVAMCAKEDIPLLVMMIGLYVTVFKERRVGALTALMGLGWFLVCTLVILPGYNGLPSSPFLHRLAVFGPTPQASLANALQHPTLALQWLVKPEIVAYLAGLLASAGWMSLFSPAILGLSLPVLAVNVFSTWDWTYSEGAHYSAALVPFVIVSGIYGTGFLASRVSRWLKVPRRWAVHGLACFVLLVSLVHHYQIGISPLSRSFHPPQITAHHRLGRELMALVPPGAPLSAQSGLYPHLAHREKAYLFPAINDAEYVFVDVTGPSYPIAQEEVYETVQQLLHAGQFGILAAQDGYLLLERGPSGGPEPGLPDAFYTFARADGETISHPLQARFGDTIELLGYDYGMSNVVHAGQVPASVITYWRLLKPVTEDYRLAFFFSRADGALVYLYDGPTPASLWYPMPRWQGGEGIRVETPPLSVGRLQDVLVVVTAPAADPWSVEERLRPVDSTGEQDLAIYEEGTLLKLFGFP